jgi:hypothetical protein
MSETRAPRRIQRKRTEGWRMPEGAVYVGRPTKWGNPFEVGAWIEKHDDLWPYLVTPFTHPNVARAMAGLERVRVNSRLTAVECYQFWLCEQPQLMASAQELEGHDLACWCPAKAPCHADVLLELANS